MWCNRKNVIYSQMWLNFLWVFVTLYLPAAALFHIIPIIFHNCDFISQMQLYFLELQIQSSVMKL